MPIHEYECKHGHITEKIFFTFAAAEGVDVVECEYRGVTPECGSRCDLNDPMHACRLDAHRVEFSVPGAPILLGEGFYKPSPSGRTTLNNADPTKVMAELNQAAGGDFAKAVLPGSDVKASTRD